MRKVKKIILIIFLLIFASQGTGLNSLALAQEISSYNRNVIRETQRLDPLLIAVSYTHLTLPTICSV